jgi:hypothetical protein
MIRHPMQGMNLYGFYFQVQRKATLWPSPPKPRNARIASRINATIGQISDGVGNPFPLVPLAEQRAEPARNGKAFPFNAGCFCLLELRQGLNAEAIRQELIHDESVGVVSQGDRYLRIAFCSLDEAAIVPLVRALDRVCERNRSAPFPAAPHRGGRRPGCRAHGMAP